MKSLIARVAAGALVVVSLPSAAQAGTNCHHVNGKFDLWLDAGVLSGTMHGDGLLRGTLQAVILEGANDAGLTNPPYTPLSYIAAVTFTTNDGLAYADDLGLIVTPDPAEDFAIFSSAAVVTGGTGKLEGATGYLFSHGTITDGGSHYVGEQTGEICLGDEPSSTGKE